MKKVLPFLFLFSMLYFASAQDFKTVGYLPHYRFSVLQELDFDQLTHVNISFANPDMAGNLMLGDGVDIGQAVDLIHEAGAEAYIALAGGFLLPEWEAAWDHNMVAERRSAFIHKIIRYAIDEKLDGVDMDLEWSHVNELYSPFVMELADSLDVYNLAFTAALPGTYRYPEISDEALGVFDWINIMAYDLRGGWNPADAGPHSPFSFALASMNHWRAQGVESERLTLGVPFYGYDFSDPTKTVSMTFDAIVKQDEDNAYKDSTGDIHYNGIPTIIEKTQLAMAELSGIMIWELGQDHLGEFSLLNTIYNTINDQASSVEQQLATIPLEVFPNPFVNEISVKWTEKVDLMSIQVFNVNGTLVHNEEFENSNEAVLDTDHLPNGTYALSLTSKVGHSSVLVVK